jgi:peptidoglycan hydrolase-like protein with peptidoglycan-binding domain
LSSLRDYTIEPNDSGELTKWTQQKLKALGYDVDVNGTADTKTMNAIHKFQKDNGLGEGKCLGGGDWAVLLKK